jgi:hypothetical protein
MASLERLIAVLEAYGSAPARWPADEREALQALAQRHPGMAGRLQEARALDRVLATAPVASEDNLAGLRRRIMASAEGRRGAVSPPGHRSIADLAYRPARPRFDLRRTWPAATALAASLILGVFIGTTETGRPAVEGLVETAGIEVSDDSPLDLIETSSEELL